MNDPLTSTGERRRQEILADAIRVARRRRTNRVATRIGGATLVAAAIAIFAFRSEPPQPAPPIAIVPPPPTRASIVLAKPPAPSITIVRIGNEHRAPTAILVERLDDAALLRTLAAAGKPAGLATIGGRQMLLTDNGPLSSASP